MKLIILFNLIIIMISLYVFCMPFKILINRILEHITNYLNDENSSKYSLYQIKNIKNITHGIWLDKNTIAVVNKEQIYKYDVQNREVINSFDTPKNSGTYILGSDGSKLLLCFYKNFQKNTKNDTGTNVRIINIVSQSSFDINFKETLKINICKDTFLYLSSAYDFIEEKNYIYDMKNKALSLTNDNLNNEYILEGNKETIISKDEKEIIQLPRVNTFEYIQVYDNRRIMLIDNEGYAWIYLSLSN